MQFRKEALERTHSQQTLDLPVRLTSPRGWIVLAVLAAVVLGGGTWASAATLPRALNATGLITSPRGSFAIQTIAAGQITETFVQQGSEVKRGSRVARVSDGRSETIVRAPADGRVFSLAARTGQVVTAGATLAVAEYTGASAGRLVAVLYLPDASVGSVKPGALVDLSVASAPVTPFGVLRGRITSVDPFVSTRRDIADFVGDDDLAQVIADGGSARRVVVELLASDTTASGYEWSTHSGPPFKIDSRTSVQGAIEQPPTRPVDWVIPT
jgi:multidrug efflux pump subunit AcrA (membrane-fusion protein)